MCEPIAKKFKPETMISAQDVYIVGAKRTPCGSLQGSLSPLTASQIASFSHKAALEQAKLTDFSELDEIITGCVLQAGQGQGPARQAAAAAGIPFSVPTTTVNKMCGSGMISVMMGCSLIKTENAQVVLAGGMESMSNAPYILTKARSGYRLGHGEIKDHMFLDGLEDAFETGKLMGCFADETAQRLGITREQQDSFAAMSMQRAADAHENGAFLNEISPVKLVGRTGESVITRDEAVDACKVAKLPRLKPAFSPSGTVTPGNASSISDGAASIVLMSGAAISRRGILPLARVVASVTHSEEPQYFTTSPIGAVRKVLLKANWNVCDVDLFEINEAFAVVTLGTMQALGVSADIVNVNGGACAIGHPIGASGARIIVSLIYALKARNKSKGIAAICIGGGESTAVAIEIFPDA